MTQDKREWVEQGQRNAQTLSEAIHGLRMPNSDFLGKIVRYKEFWEQCSHVSDLFKALKPLPQDDRERLWSEFNRMRDEVRSQQNQERDARRSVSAQRRVIVQDCIREAGHAIGGAPDLDYLQRADDLLARALEMMKGGYDWANVQTQIFAVLTFDDGKMTREDHQACWEQWQKAKDALRARKLEIRQLNYEQAHREASAALSAAHYSDPYEALGTIKQAQASVKGLSMPRERGDEIWRTLQDAWDTATGRIEALKEEKVRKHEEWQRKQDEWRERQEGHIERWEELIEKNEGVVARIEQQIDHCQDILADAKTDDFAATVQGWIDEKQDKIRDILETNSELADRIRDVRRKLDA